MPVFKIGEELCYFTHVPKCGGNSVEAYLKKRFGYDMEHLEPAAPKLALHADFIAARDAERARTSRLFHRTTTRIRRGITRRLG